MIAGNMLKTQKEPCCRSDLALGYSSNKGENSQSCNEYHATFAFQGNFNPEGFQSGGSLTTLPVCQQLQRPGSLHHKNQSQADRT